jgi:PEGA domain
VRLGPRLLLLSLAALLVRSTASSTPGSTELRIITSPEGAEVFIGNVLLGVTPRSGLKVVTQAAGAITCTIRKEGYVPVERIVSFERGAPTSMVLRVTLEPMPSQTEGAPGAVAASASAPASGPPAPETAARTSRATPRVPPPAAPAKAGASHKGLMLGAVGGAAAAGAGVAVASKRNGTTGGGASSPAAATFSGTYSGSVQDSLGGGGPVNLTLTHSTNYVTGTWHGPEPVWRALNGTVSSAGAMAATLLPSANTACPFSLSASVAGDRLTGTFTSFNCPVPLRGTVDLTRH